MLLEREILSWDPSFFKCFKNTFQAEGGSDKVLTLQNLYSLKSREVRTPVSPMPLLPCQIAATVLSLPTISHTIWPDLTAEAIRTTVVPIRILIRTTVVPIRILIGTTVVPVVPIRILIGTTVVQIRILIGTTGI